MKKNTLLFFALFISFSISSQNIDWSQKISSQYQISSNGLITENVNKIWLFYSLYDSASIKRQNLINKYDQSGNLLSTDSLPLKLDIYYVQNSNHSTIYLYGFSNDSTIILSGHNIYGYFIAEMDYNNNWLGISAIQQNPLGGVYDIKFDQSGNLYFAQVVESAPHFVDAFEKFDLTGNLIYETVDSSPHGRGGKTVQPVSSGNCFGFVIDKNYQNYFNQFDSIGNLLAKIPFEFTGYYLQMTTDFSNNLYIIGEFSDTIRIGTELLQGTLNPYNLFITKMDSQHNFVWSRILNRTGNVNVRHEKIICDPVNNRLYFTGSYSDSIFFYGNGYGSYDSSGQSSLFIGSIDLDGNAPWITTIPSSNSVIPGSIVSDQKGNIYILGSFVDTLFASPSLVSEINGSAFLMKIKDESINNKSDSLNNTILIYPNPADKYVSVYLPNGKYSHLQLINNIGAIVKDFVDQGNYLQMSIENFSNGIYYLRAINEDKKTFSTKLIVMHKK